jgi:hypothetical protein
MLAKTGWLKEWSKLDLWENRIWDDWAKAIAEALAKTDWLKEWSILKLNSNRIWEVWKSALQKLRDYTQSKWINCEIDF